ncbi:hypothetical protein IU459_18015 [Nocardia amamiensis]|uniref:Bacterial EndoU nuclease domain-containing protein n=1 Tax=Nocardia amamiensis TaxID=404578 RepID=A0ABS0CS68_9NOCA|nr:hypothetical protein [Nocardia amamiensis]MBF6299422.1 hypothetical protein [Nocardia amamiensis]
MIVDWQVYYDAAKKCHDLAADLRRADKPLHDAVKGECAGMAGDAPGCKQWGEKYDQIARSTMQTCTNLADALTNYGYVLAANGYNHGIRNKSNPPPPRPDVRAMTEYTVTIPTSVRDNGTGVKHSGGVDEFFAILVTKILEEFGKLPNGDVDKLAKAATTWDNFAKNDTITSAAGRISAIAAMFDGMDDPLNRQMIQDQFNVLRTGADQIATASLNVAAPVTSYHTGTLDVSRGIQSAITTAEWAIGLIVVAAAATALLSFGGSLAAGGGGVAAAVAETIATIRSLYQASNLIRVVGLTAAAAGAVGVISAFDKVPDLTSISTSLATIIAMRVLIDGDDEERAVGGPDVSSQIHNPSLTDKAEEYVRSKHFPGGSQVTDKKSIFYPEEDIDALVEAADNQPATGPNKNGNYERIVEADHTIGNLSKSAGGAPTRRYVVVQDKYGGVITMYPIP